MKRRRKPAKRHDPSVILTIATMEVVEKGCTLSFSLLVDCVGAIAADDAIKHGRKLYLAQGCPIFVRGLLTAGGAR